MASPPAVRAPPARSPRSPEQIHLPDPGLPQSQKQEVASILSTLDSQQTALFRYADRNYLKACFRRGFLGVQDSARRFAAQAAGSSLVNRRALKGFNTWFAFSSLRARRRRLLLGALVSLQERRLRAGLNSWKAQRAVRELALERLSQGARQWVSRAVGGAYRKWAEGVAKRARMRACARSVADSRSRRAMNGWMASAYERGERARRMGGALASLRGRHSRRALNRWAGDARGRRAATRHLSAATRRWVGRATAAAYRTWAADVQTRARLRGCVETMRDSRVRRVVNTWAEEGAARAQREQAVRQSLVSLRDNQSRRAMNTMKGALAARAVARGAAASLLHGKLRRAHNTWARRAGGGSADARRLHLAAMEWTSIGLRRGWYRWRGLVLMRSTQLGPTMAPPSSFALRTMMWMRERDATVQQQLVLAAGDEKYMCVRMLLRPHAALVFHANGAMLRVVRVRGHPTAMCAVDLAAGEENRLLSVKDLPVARLGPPEFPLAVPSFFGGVLQLLDGVGVRVVDVDFDAGAQAEQAYEAKQLGLANAEAEEGEAKGGEYGRAYSSRALHLSRVKLVLVDDKGHAVGQPAWAAVHDLLDRLADSSINAFDFVAEEELRRRTRERLHRKERLRVGLFSLATARPDVRGHVIHDTSPGATAAPGVLPGVAGLLQPLREQIARPHHHAKSAAGLLTSRAPPVLPRKQERRRSADEN